jgi:hypothetical protein
MITFNFKTSIALLLIGMAAGFCFSFLFNGCGNDAGVTHERIVPVKDLKKEADSKEASYKEKITELENKNAELQQQLKTTKEQLVAIKSKTKQRENNIKKIITPDSYQQRGYPAKELLEKIKPAAIADTVLSPCDSLVNEVSEYMQENAIKDSLYESQIGMQDSLMAGKDSVIEMKSRFHQDLQRLFDQSLAQLEVLVKENTQLRKQFKRQKFKSRLISIGVTVLSGLAANYLIHH